MSNATGWNIASPVFVGGFEPYYLAIADFEPYLSQTRLSP
jgi:hypothetical protein